MARPTKVLLLLGLLVALWAAEAHAGVRTVCTITVNSADEKEAFRRHLPDQRYRFVELVERGRPDWLASACRQGIRCDVLVISGHFDGSTVFYSDQLGAREHLPVEELERVSCSDSCPGLFSQLKEVYLFGCNTLNADPIRHASPELERSLVRAGYPPADAARRAHFLEQRHEESSRDRMRRIFHDVPVIYGFSSVAPLGPTAAVLLDRHFQSAPGSGVGGGRASPGLLARFADESMIAVHGLGDSDPHAAYRSDVCRFLDDRPSPAEKLRFAHEILDREMAEVRMYFERLERLFSSFDGEARRAPAFVAALGEITRDHAARARYLRFAADADDPGVRARMLGFAGELGWLSPAQQRTELGRVAGDLMAGRSISAADVDLACALNADGRLDGERSRLPPAAPERDTAHAAILACLGSADDHRRMLAALTGPDDAAVEIARAYFARRPITDVGELRTVAVALTRMTDTGAQARALQTLARLRLSDRESLDALARLFVLTRSVEVQRAIAGVFIRADQQWLIQSGVVDVLSRSRLVGAGGEDIIDVLIRRLEVSP